MIRKITLTCFCIILSLTTYSQATHKIKQLKIGDTIPDMIFTNFLNGKEQPERASDLYKQGGLIINFWATWCVPCIRELPRLDSLQEKYEDHLSFICFTPQNAKIVSKFFKQHPKLNPRHLRIVIGDTVLDKMFPHRTIPHNAWIDKYGCVKEITGDKEINSKNIAGFIAGRGLHLPVKSEDMNFDYRKPFHVSDTGFIYRSILTRHNNDIGNGGITSTWDSTHTLIKRFFGWNRTIADLLWAAYRPFSMFNYKLIDLRTKDSTKFLWPHYIDNIYKRSRYKNRKQWLNANVYCYALSIPNGVKKDLFYSYVNQDICRYFNVSTSVEIRNIPCWVVTKKPNSYIFHPSKYKKSFVQLIGNAADSAKFTVRRKTINEIFAYFLNTNHFDPYVNKTGINYPIDLSIQFTQLKGSVPIDALKRKLAKYGFVFKKEIQPYPILVIRDNDSISK